MFFLFGIRHGQCDKNTLTGKYEHDNVSLNVQGRSEIQTCARFFLHHVSYPPGYIDIYCSPLPRVVQSATLLMHRLEQKYPVHLCVDDRLSNKQASDEDYELSLRSFLSHVQKVSETHLIVVVSHGRVLKMLRSLSYVGKIDADFIQQLEDFCHGHVYTFSFSEINFFQR